MKNEFEFIAWLRGQIVVKPTDLIVGVGDDAAIFQCAADRELLITTDLLLEDIHFSLDFTPPQLLGNKSLAVNLSDIAAMGGRPRYFLLGISRPRHISDETLEAIVTGMLTLANEHQVSLIGGDTCASRDRLVISITALGECPRGKAVRRNTAKPGDQIYVSGKLGGSALGLELMRAGKRLTNNHLELLNTNSIETAALRAHLLPQARTTLGVTIGELELATAMIDISDGLSSDLGHICQESGVGVELDAASLPLLPGATLEQALNGGEDYELLFTVPAARQAEVEQLDRQFSMIGLTHIGQITSQPERWLIKDGRRIPLIARGFDHFAE